MPPCAVPTHILLEGGDALADADATTLGAFAAARLTQLAQSPDVAPCIVSLHLPWESQLSALAEPLQRLTALQSLELHLCKLLGSVEALWGLSHLTHIAFNGALATGSWSGLSRLTGLRSLGLLSFSHQPAVAAALPSLGLLTCLKIGRAQPGHPPANWSSVSTLTALRSLTLNTDQAAHVLRHLPAASLQHLHLATSDLTLLPAQLSTCTALTNLVLAHSLAEVEGGAPGGTLVAHRFANLAPLTNLQVLVLSNLRIQPAEVPPGIAALTSLTYICLESTNIAAGWNRLQAVPLHRLVITSDHLPRLPAMPSLTDLTLHGNPDLPPPPPAELAVCLAPHTQLIELSLTDYNLPAVPPVISQLTRLTFLDLSGNPIAAGMEHLEILDLEDLVLDDDPIIDVEEW